MKTYAPVAPGARPTYTNSRPVFVIDDLRHLRGSAVGTVHLPLHLDWSSAASYDLSDPRRLRTLYATVLREAMSEADLAEHLNTDLLIEQWPQLRLPGFVRACWEDTHPELRPH